MGYKPTDKINIRNLITHFGFHVLSLQEVKANILGQKDVVDIVTVFRLCISLYTISKKKKKKETSNKLTMLNAMARFFAIVAFAKFNKKLHSKQLECMRE